MIPKASYFEFTSYTTDWISGELCFSYKVQLENGESHEFTERLFIQNSVSQERVNQTAVEEVLQMIHLTLGVSYFKLYGPAEIRHHYKITSQDAHYWNTLYTQGMGEFYYVNNLEFKDRVSFEVTQDLPRPKDVTTSLQERSLVLHGGGKDSATSVEIVKKAGLDFDLFAMNGYDIQLEVAKVMNKEMCLIKRSIDPLLIDLNTEGNVYNGHVPIAAIYSALAILYAVLFDYKYVIVSNERSAVYGNVEYKGMTVNHQWDKSQEYESLLREYLTNALSTDVDYFSLLRPLYEIHIVKIFTQFTQYFEVFSSSNHNFKIGQDGKKKRWDTEFSKGKVEFVWALFSAFLSKSDMLRIFEEDIYADSNLLLKFQELLGVKNIKPLECVGTPDEMKVAMYMCYDRGEFNETPIMQYFISEVLPLIGDTDELKKEVFSYGDDSHLPPLLKDALSAIMSG